MKILSKIILITILILNIFSINIHANQKAISQTSIKIIKSQNINHKSYNIYDFGELRKQAYININFFGKDLFGKHLNQTDYNNINNHSYLHDNSSNYIINNYFFKNV